MHLEELVPDQDLSVRPNQPRSTVGEIYAFKRGFNMKLARLARIVRSIPIEDPISRIAVLLDFNQQIPAANCVKASRWKKHGIAVPHRNRVDMICYRALLNGAAKILFADFLPQANE